jgi:hypothetical protein
MGVGKIALFGPNFGKIRLSGIFLYKSGGDGVYRMKSESN